MPLNISLSRLTTNSLLPKNEVEVIIGNTLSSSPLASLHDIAMIHDYSAPNSNLLIPAGSAISLPTSPGLSFSSPASQPYSYIMMGFRCSFRLVNGVIVEGAFVDTSPTRRLNGGSNSVGSLDNDYNGFTTSTTTTWTTFETFHFEPYDGTAQTYAWYMRNSSGSAQNYGFNYRFWARFVS